MLIDVCRSQIYAIFTYESLYLLLVFYQADKFCNCIVDAFFHCLYRWQKAVFLLQARFWQLLGDSDSFCEILTASNRFWQILWDSDSFWEILTASGRFWQLLGDSDSFWEISDSFWEILAAFGRFWQLLGDSDSFWEILAASGRFWQLLRDSDSFWEILTTLRKYCQHRTLEAYSDADADARYSHLNPEDRDSCLEY
jgi:hypothetical protein